MPEQGSEFAEILRRLNENNVRYVLIGGLAMMLHGSAHIISMKRAANRPKDQGHLMELEALRRFHNGDSH